MLDVSNGCHNYVPIQESFAFGNRSSRDVVLAFAIENLKTVSLLYMKKNKKSKAINFCKKNLIQA